MAKRQVKLIFPQTLIKEPVTYQMAKQYKVVFNIRRARVTESVGEMLIELEGAEEDLDKAVAFFELKGVKVEPVTGDVVSP